eukprot:gene31045-38939_t
MSGKVGRGEIVVFAAGNINVNFQDAGTQTPSGWQKDIGLAYGDRAGGYAYGWSCDITRSGRNRHSRSHGALDNTFIILDRYSECADTKWEIALANGAYDVTITYFDPSFGHAASSIG